MPRSPHEPGLPSESSTPRRRPSRRDRARGVPRHGGDMSADDPGAGHRARVRELVDSVEWVSSEVQLADICRIDDAALTVEERIRWAGWQRAEAGELRGRVRAQAGCAALAAVAGTLAWLFTVLGDQSAVRGQLLPALLAAAGIAMCGAAVLIEIEMADHAGYQPWPVRFRLRRKTREWVNLQPLRDSVDDELAGGQRAHEARLVVVAKAVAAAITHSAMWPSTCLDTYELRCDVQLDLVGIARAAVKLCDQRRNAARNSTDPLRSTAAVAGSEASEALLSRLAWLHRYLTQLQMLPAVSAEAERSASRRRTAGVEHVITEIRFTILALEGLAPDTGGIR